ncbi:MAG: DUF4097 domain-containing protein [Clostridiales bacterium]|nr:DUF4097 domain-containing protein [Clostridiales bacterium]
MKKVLIIIAVVVLVAGLVIFASAFIAAGFDFSKIGKAKYETHIYTADTNFSKIEVHSTVDDITFKPSSDGKCSIECLEEDKVTHTVEVENGTLKIGVKDERQWIDLISLFKKTPYITVYLPSDTYESVTAECITGDILIPRAFSFGNIVIDGDTGNILCGASATESITINSTTGSISITGVRSNNMTLKATTGKITASTVECSGDVSVKVTTGDIVLVDFDCNSLKCNGTTGSVILTNVTATGDFNIEDGTGTVHFDKCDAANIYVKSTTGNISGSLMTEKDFRAKSSTGKVNVPDTRTGGICEISSTTGNINITIAES